MTDGEIFRLRLLNNRSPFNRIITTGIIQIAFQIIFNLFDSPIPFVIIYYFFRSSLLVFFRITSGNAYCNNDKS